MSTKLKVSVSGAVIAFSALTLALSLMVLQPVTAQTTDTQRSCRSVASDADGDGFGWEWDPQTSQYSSCTVTDQSATAPNAIDAFGNVTDELQIRAYWNANRDFADRTVVCEQFGHVPGNIEVRSSFEFNHDVLPSISPFIAFADFSNDWPSTSHTFLGQNWPAKYYSVLDGRYSGPMPIGSWVQIIDRNGQPDNAVRVNTSNANFECFDPTGRAFIPTGSLEEALPAPQEVQAPTILVTGAANSVLVPDTEVIIDRRTGNEVDLQPAVWDLYNDLIGRQIACWGEDWSDSSLDYVNMTGEVRYVTFYPIHQPSSQMNGLVTETTADNSYTTNSDFTIEDGELKLSSWFHSTPFSSFFSPKFVEFIEREEFALGNGESINTPKSIGVWLDSERRYRCADNGKVVIGGALDRTAARALRPSGAIATSENPMSNEPVTATDNGEQSNQGDEGQVETSITDESSGTTGNGSVSTGSTEDQSGSVVNTPAQTSGSGAADKFLLLFLICFLGRKSSKIG